MWIVTGEWSYDFWGAVGEYACGRSALACGFSSRFHGFPTLCTVQPPPLSRPFRINGISRRRLLNARRFRRRRRRADSSIAAAPLPVSLSILTPIPCALSSASWSDVHPPPSRVWVLPQPEAPVATYTQRCTFGSYIASLKAAPFEAVFPKTVLACLCNDIFISEFHGWNRIAAATAARARASLLAVCHELIQPFDVFVFLRPSTPHSSRKLRRNFAFAAVKFEIVSASFCWRRLFVAAADSSVVLRRTTTSFTKWSTDTVVFWEAVARRGLCVWRAALDVQVVLGKGAIWLAGKSIKWLRTSLCRPLSSSYIPLRRVADTFPFLSD